MSTDGKSSTPRESPWSTADGTTWRYGSVKQLVDTVTGIAKKLVNTTYVQGPVGVQSRNFSNEKIYSTGWRPQFSLQDGIRRTYPWIEAQVLATRHSSAPRPKVLA